MKQEIKNQIHAFASDYLSDYVAVCIKQEWGKTVDDLSAEAITLVMNSDEFFNKYIKEDLLDKNFTEDEINTFFYHFDDLKDNTLYKLLAYFACLNNDYEDIDELKESLVDIGADMNLYSDDELNKILQASNTIY